MDDTLKDRFLEAVTGTACGFALFDSNDRLAMANPWFEEAFNVRADGSTTWELMLRACHATGRGVLIETDDIDAWLAQVRTRYRQTPVRSFQSDLADGRWLWVIETVLKDGWVSVACSDVSALKTTESALREARDEAVRVSMKDPLTDLYNRRFIMRHLGEMLASSRAVRWPLSLAMLDIDYFKRINDSAGHDVGDAVLCHFAEQLKKQLRPMDAVGRIGGEEFLVVLTNTGLDGAVQTLGRVRRLVAESIAAETKLVPEYTFSAGIAQACSDDNVDSLFRRADQALFQAKRDGRNRDWAVNSRSMRL